MMSVKVCSLILASLVALGVVAKEASPGLRGSWTATAGPTQVLRGTWTAQAAAGTSNLVAGSWTLLSDAGEVLLQGSWSARKSRSTWQGTWRARTLSGQSFSGTWSAHVSEGDFRSFERMLESAAEKQIAGSWQSGPYRGNWWLGGIALQDRQR
jgi:hypothetical protein